MKGFKQVISGLFLLPAIVSGICCTTNPSRSKIVCTSISSVYPVIDSGGNVQGYDSQVVKIYYKNDIELIDMPFYITKKEKGHTSSIRKSLIVVFKKDKPKGMLYQDFDPAYREIVDIDSLLKQQWFGTTELYNLFEQNKMIKKHSEKKGAGQLIEKYEIKNLKTDSIVGECLFDYEPMSLWENERLSLSPKLDHQKVMKLTDVQLSIVKRYDSMLKSTVPAILLRTRIERVIVPDKKPEVLNYFDTFYVDSKRRPVI